jgi:DNA invertase Pin-like site-specific DNA recombinase
MRAMRSDERSSAFVNSTAVTRRSSGSAKYWSASRTMRRCSARSRMSLAKRRGSPGFERPRAGLDRARAQGKRLGRPITPDRVTGRVHELRRAVIGMDRIARELGIGKSVAQRICQAMENE